MRALATFVALILAAAAEAQVSTRPPGSSGGGTFAGGTITAPLLAPATDCTPVAYSFTGWTTSGFGHGTSTDYVVLCVGGTARLTASATTFTSTVPFLGPNGTAGSPSITFASNTNTGLYRSGADQLGFAAGGLAVFRLFSTTLLFESGKNITGANGTAAAPMYMFPDASGVFGGGSDTRISGNGTLQAVFASSSTQVRAGSTTTLATVGGVVGHNTVSTGNVGAGEDDLHSYTIVANATPTVGQSIRLVASGTFAATANNKELRVKLGSTTIFDTGSLVTAVATDWTVQCETFVSGANTQKSMCQFLSDGTALAQDVDYTTSSEVTTSAIILKLTGEATANDDIVCEISKMEWVPRNVGGS